MTTEKLNLSEEEWRDRLTPEQYQVLREKKTECAFRGKYHQSHEEGTYVCAGCELPLFVSKSKFDSGTGWPSFWEPVSSENIEIIPDHTLGYRRYEVLCRRCRGHLGHVFDDGPLPTGQRYCINSVALNFIPK